MVFRRGRGPPGGNRCTGATRSASSSYSPSVRSRRRSSRGPRAPRRVHPPAVILTSAPGPILPGRRRRPIPREGVPHTGCPCDATSTGGTFTALGAGRSLAGPPTGQQPQGARDRLGPGARPFRRGASRRRAGRAGSAGRDRGLARRARCRGPAGRWTGSCGSRGGPGLLEMVRPGLGPLPVVGEASGGDNLRIGAKVVSHSKAVTFQMAEVTVPRRLFASNLDRIGCLRLVPGTG
jgi:hypothetical protein